VIDDGSIGVDSNKNGAIPDPPSAQMYPGRPGFYIEDSKTEYDNFAIYPIL
jgi:hypothetical protein